MLPTCVAPQRRLGANPDNGSLTAKREIMAPRWCVSHGDKCAACGVSGSASAGTGDDGRRMLGRGSSWPFGLRGDTLMRLCTAPASTITQHAARRCPRRRVRTVPGDPPWLGSELNPGCRWGGSWPQASYEEFCALFPPTDCRYGVYDYDYTDSEGCQKSKIVFFAWCAEQLVFPALPTCTRHVPDSSSCSACMPGSRVQVRLYYDAGTELPSAPSGRRTLPR